MADSAVAKPSRQHHPLDGQQRRPETLCGRLRSSRCRTAATLRRTGLFSQRLGRGQHQHLLPITRRQSLLHRKGQRQHVPHRRNGPSGTYPHRRLRQSRRRPVLHAHVDIVAGPIRRWHHLHGR